MLPRAAVTAVLVLLVAASAGAAATGLAPSNASSVQNVRRRSICELWGARPYHPEY